MSFLIYKNLFKMKQQEEKIKRIMSKKRITIIKILIT